MRDMQGARERRDGSRMAGLSSGRGRGGVDEEGDTGDGKGCVRAVFALHVLLGAAKHLLFVGGGRESRTRDVPTKERGELSVPGGFKGSGGGNVSVHGRRERGVGSVGAREKRGDRGR